MKPRSRLDIMKQCHVVTVDSDGGGVTVWLVPLVKTTQADPLTWTPSPRPREAFPGPEDTEQALPSLNVNSFRYTQLQHSCKRAKMAAASQLPHLLVQSLVVLKQRLEGLEDLHLAGHPCRRLGLSLHHSHPQTTLVSRHEALQVLQQQLWKRDRKVERETERLKERQKG